MLSEDKLSSQYKVVQDIKILHLKELDRATDVIANNDYLTFAAMSFS